MAFAQNGGGKTTGKKHNYNKNGESHCFQCRSEYYWANIFLRSTSISKGKYMTNLKMKN